MINSWREDIRRGGQLRIAAKPGLKSPPWAGLLPKAIKAFNALSATHDLGVVYVAGGEVEQAHVTVDTRPGFTLSGSASYRSDVPSGKPDSAGRVFHCDVLLPADPKVSVPGQHRRVGNDVLLVILVHEMVHACGLSNSEHSESGDLFMPSPRLLTGDRAAQDKVDSGRVGARQTPIGMPPLLLNDETAAKIRQAWQGPTAAATGSGMGIGVGAGRLAGARHGPIGIGTASDPATGARRPGPLGQPGSEADVARRWT